MSGTYSDSNRHRMHEADKRLMNEIRQLEVAVYDLKTENNLLHEALDQVIEDRDSYHDDDGDLDRLNQDI